jgi:hypothetical protein
LVLECRYNRFGDVRRSPPPPRGRRHPGGVRACRALDQARQGFDDHDRALATGCPGDRRARITGVYRGRRVTPTSLGVGDCETTWFELDKGELLVPRLSGAS